MSFVHFQYKPLVESDIRVIRKYMSDASGKGSVEFRDMCGLVTLWARNTWLGEKIWPIWEYVIIPDVRAPWLSLENHSSGSCSIPSQGPGGWDWTEKGNFQGSRPVGVVIFEYHTELMSEAIIRLETLRFLRPSIETDYSCLRMTGFDKEYIKIFALISARESGRTLDWGNVAPGVDWEVQLSAD